MHASTTEISEPLRVGAVLARNRVFLAPMSGITDLPFRKLAHRFGAGLVFTEMVASRELTTDSRESWARMRGDGLSPHCVQLAGREAFWMGEAARIAEDHGADLIDINMGCPAKKVTGGYSGSALMRNPDHAIELVEAVIAAVKVPVTVKMRLGWDDNTLNAPDIAARAQDAGAAMITVHGRTRMQFYEGTADWDAVARVRAVLSVPLVVNGDIGTARDIRSAVKASGADAVMIGRKVQGAPWLCGELAGVKVPVRRVERISIAVEHYDAMIDHYGETVGVRQARKHLAAYIDNLAPETSGETRLAIMTGKESATVRRRFEEALMEAAEHQAEEKAA